MYTEVLRGTGKPNHWDFSVSKQRGAGRGARRYDRKDNILMILKKSDTVLTALEEQELMERDAQGKVTRAERQPGKFLVKCFLETGRRMSVCSAGRYHVSVYVPIYIWYVRVYI